MKLILDTHGLVFVYPGSYTTKPFSSPPGALISLNAEALTVPSSDIGIRYARPVRESTISSVPPPGFLDDDDVFVALKHSSRPHVVVVVVVVLRDALSVVKDALFSAAQSSNSFPSRRVLDRFAILRRNVVKVLFVVVVAFGAAVVISSSSSFPRRYIIFHAILST
jgi:hypothetical protein